MVISCMKNIFLLNAFIIYPLFTFTNLIEGHWEAKANTPTKFDSIITLICLGLAFQEPGRPAAMNPRGEKVSQLYSTVLIHHAWTGVTLSLNTQQRSGTG